MKRTWKRLLGFILVAAMLLTNLGALALSQTPAGAPDLGDDDGQTGEESRPITFYTAEGASLNNWLRFNDKNPNNYKFVAKAVNNGISYALAAAEYVADTGMVYGINGTLCYLCSTPADDLSKLLYLNNKRLASSYDLAYDYSRGKMYISNTDGLFTWDLETNETQLVGAYKGVTGMSVYMAGLAITPSGEAYGLAITAANYVSLYKIDLSTVECTLIGATGLQATRTYGSQNLAYDQDSGRLFWLQRFSTTRNLVELDVETGTGVILGSLPSTVCSLFIGEPVPVEKIEIPEDTYEVAAGSRINIPYMVTPGDALFKDIRWSSSNPAVASVSSGVVIGISAGTAEITVTVTSDDGSQKTDTCAVTVTGGSGASPTYFVAYNALENYWQLFGEQKPADVSNLSAQGLVTAAEYAQGKVYGYFDGNGSFFAANIDSFGYYEIIGKSVVPTGMVVGDMAYDRSTGIMYALYGQILGTQGADTRMSLYTVDLKTGELTLVGDFHGSDEAIWTLAITTEGKAYGLSYGIVSGVGAMLYEIDLATSECTPVGATGFALQPHLQSMAYDHGTGRMFWAQCAMQRQDLVNIDLKTGAGTSYGALKDKGATAEFTALIPLPIVSTDPAIHSVEVSTPDIAAGLAANLHISVTGENLADRAVTAYLKVGDDLLYPTEITNGQGRMAIGKAPEAGTYKLVVRCGDAEGSCDIRVAPYNPGIWSTAAVKGGDGLLNIRIGADISSFTGSVTIGSDVYGATLKDDNTLVVRDVNYDNLPSGTKIVVSGVKCRLFPSYLFTFTVRIP